MYDKDSYAMGPWSPLFQRGAVEVSPEGPFPIAVLTGEGVGPEVLAAALEVLDAVERGRTSRFRMHTLHSERTEDVVEACRALFARGGALLAGPKGGRFVYDLRRELNLFCKLSPIVGYPELRGACRLRTRAAGCADLLIVRENTMGVYQGSASEEVTCEEGRLVRHRFEYSERAVRRVLRAAARIARRRRRKLAVVLKRGGLPEMSRLWGDCAVEAAAESDVECSELDVDYAVYKIIQHPEELDVVVAPNLFGDILSDAGGVLVGSRGLTYGGSFGSGCGAVYQTNHGAAHELAGTDRANPAGQILALAMLLRESFGLLEEAARIESALRRVWASGWRTADLTENGCRLVGTRRLASLTAETLVEFQEVS